jgi:hypothetical protein
MPICFITRVPPISLLHCTARDPDMHSKSGVWHATQLQAIAIDVDTVGVDPYHTTAPDNTPSGQASTHDSKSQACKTLKQALLLPSYCIHACCMDKHG